MADIQISQPGESCQRVGQCTQAVVVEIEKIGQAFEITQCIRYGGQHIVSQVERAKVFQGSDSIGYLGKVVIREDERFEFYLLPNRGRYLSEVPFPKIYR